MKIFEKRKNLIQYLDGLREKSKSIGFVPTMGALHKGHLDLIKKAKKQNDVVVCSIFVNPTQFNNKEDLKKYPRTLESDIKKLKSVQCDVLFAPEEKEMYPGKVEQDIKLNLGKLDKVLEGKFRPGHFKGVATIVDKLFKIVEPDKAYFGEKDFQQLLVIKQMVEMLGHKVKVVPCPTVRETDGLAMSSRNTRLSKEQRQAAPFIYKTLKKAKKLSKDLSPAEVKSWAKKEFKANKNLKLEYFEIADASSLMPLKKIGPNTKAVACVAAFMGSVRLIDNIKFQVRNNR